MIILITGLGLGFYYATQQDNVETSSTSVSTNKSQKTVSESSDLNQGDEKQGPSIKILPTDNNDKNNIKLSAMTSCQPEIYSLDPSNGEDLDIFLDNNPGVSYKKEIITENSYEFIIHRFGCASTYDYIIESMEDGVRKKLFTQVKNYEIIFEDGGGDDSDEKIYITNYIKNNNDNWELSNKIIDFKNDTTKKFPNMECNDVLSEVTTSSRSYFDYIITYSEVNDGGTNICIWDFDTNLLSNLYSKIPFWPLFGSNNPSPAFNLGLLIYYDEWLDEDYTFYLYNTYVYEGESCKLFLQKISEQEKK